MITSCFKMIISFYYIEVKNSLIIYGDASNQKFRGFLIIYGDAKMFCSAELVGGLGFFPND